MPTPTPSDVHEDALLTQFSVATLQEPNSFVADKVFPRISVNNQTDKYATFTAADFLRSAMQRRGVAAASAGSSYTTSKSPYHTEDWSLHIDVDDKTVANADSVYSPYENATAYLTQMEMLKREEEWISNFFGTGIWTTDKTGGTDFTEIGDDTSDPIGFVSDYQEAVEDLTGLLPMDLVVNRRGANALRNHPDLVARISGGASSGSPAIVTMQNIAGVLGLDRIHVASAIRNTAQEGETASISRLAGNHALLCYVNPNPGPMQQTSGATFVWNRYIGSSEGRRIKRWRDEDVESERIEINANWDQRVIGAGLGLFMSGFVAAA